MWLKKEAHCCLGQKGRPLILIYLEKKEHWGLGLNTRGIISHHCCPGRSHQKQYWSTGSEE
jgi:hypothetical protein